MGIIGNIAAGIAKDVAKDIAIDTVAPAALGAAATALDKPIKKLGEVLEESEKKSKAKREEKIKQVFACEPGTKALIINQQTYTWKSRFDIYDNLNNVKYSVVGDLASVKHHFRIYNANKQQIAHVKEKLISVRLSPFGHESDPYDFDFYIGDRKVAHMKTQFRTKNGLYTLDNGWKVKGKAWWDYAIVKDDTEVARIEPKALLMYGDTYVITMPEAENELLVLMVALAIDIMHSPTKGEELKSTARRKILNK